MTPAQIAALTDFGAIGESLLFTPATHDIGASGATRPRDLFLSRNAVVGGTLGVTGNTTLGGTLGVTGNVAVNTDKFTVAAASGNTVVAGTLGVTGNATLSGTLGVTGLITGRTFAVNANTDTGAQNDWAPTGKVAGNTYVEWSGASDIAATGIASPSQGQTFTFVNAGTKVATFAHNSGSSTAGNKLFNTVTSAPTPVAPGGHIIYIYDGGIWILVSHEQGAWITPTYAAGDFTQTGGTSWTVDSADVTTYKYRLQGRTLTVALTIQNTDVGGTPSGLNTAIPGGFTSAIQTQSFCDIIDASTRQYGILQVQAAATIIVANQGDAGNFTATTSDNTFVRGQITFEVT